MGPRFLLYLLVALICIPASSSGETDPTDPVQVAPPTYRRAEAPSKTATSAELEERGDTLRAEKAYLDALDYYRSALERTAAKEADSARLYNKAGITELQMGRFGDARKDFRRAIKLDDQFADAYNNLGVIYYLQKKYRKAIRQYEDAIKLRQNSSSFFSNLGAAYFSKKDYVKASVAYAQALQLDPEIFDRTSHNGVLAQMSSPGDRAHFYYVLAELYAKNGAPDRSLQYLRRAMEEGYKGIDDVYTDSAFATLRKDPRFTELMAARPVGIPTGVPE